jgi:hypothetical protein
LIADSNFEKFDTTKLDPEIREKISQILDEAKDIPFSDLFHFSSPVIF